MDVDAERSDGFRFVDWGQALTTKDNFANLRSDVPCDANRLAYDLQTKLRTVPLG